MPFIGVDYLIWTILVFIGFGLSVCLHEFSHAIVAYWGGDHSVKEKGYLTLNPLRYTHPTYSIVLPCVFLMLGGLPLPGAAVYINTSALKGPGWKSAVSFAGPFATFLVAVAIALLIQVVPAPLEVNILSPNDLIFQGLAVLLTLEVAGVLLNLMPVPGLDGYGVIEPWLPLPWQHQLRRYANYGVWALFAAFWFVPEFSRSFWTTVQALTLWCGVQPETTVLSLSLFREGARFLFAVALVGWVIYGNWQKRNTPEQELQKNLGLSEAALIAKLNHIDQRLSKRRNATMLSRKSLVLIALQRYDKASAVLQEALGLRPESYFDWMNLGDTWMALNREVDAIAAFDQAHHYAPNQDSHRQMLHHKSRDYFDQKRYPACLTILKAILNQHPQDASALYNQACCYAQLGYRESGMVALTQAIAQNTRDLKDKARTDSDLDPLRSHPDFSALIHEIVDPGERG